MVVGDRCGQSEFEVSSMVWMECVVLLSQPGDTSGTHTHTHTHTDKVESIAADGILKWSKIDGLDGFS